MRTDYTNGEYRCGCVSCVMSTQCSCFLMVCNCPQSNLYGSPRIRSSRDGQRWLRKCKYRMDALTAAIKQNKFKAVIKRVARKLIEAST